MKALGTTQESSIQRASSAGPSVRGLVVIFSGGSPHLWAVPLTGNRVVIGRELVPGHPLPDDRLSRAHAEVSFAAPSWRVRDLGSRNGTYVNGEKVQASVSPDTARVLRAGQTVLLFSDDIRRFQGAEVVASEKMIVGPITRQSLDLIAQTATLGDNLLITGESGTGKELAAQVFHASGTHASGPLIAVNCAAIPAGIGERLLFGVKRGAYSDAKADADGYIQAANRGVLFLDEVGELNQEVQSKLLRVLETKQVLALGASIPKRVDIRICAATHLDLRNAVAEGEFREDLFFRIGRPEVRLSPLRERCEEIPWLIERTLNTFKQTLRVHADLIESCVLRAWPGNVRELISAIRKVGQQALASRSTSVRAKDLEHSAGLWNLADGGGPRPGRAENLTREMIEAAMGKAKGNLTATAHDLGVHRTQLYRLLKTYGLS